MKLLNQYRGLRREIYILAFGRTVTNLGSMIWPVMTLLLSQKLGFSAADSDTVWCSVSGFSGTVAAFEKPKHPLKLDF